MLTYINFKVSFSFGIPGFTHSAFSLGYEAGVNNSEINGNLVPPGALITIVQKGLQYIEMEANLSDVSLVNLNWLYCLSIIIDWMCCYCLLVHFAV